MADISELSNTVSSQDKEQIEQHVEEEIVHEVVSPDQSWREDEATLMPKLENDEDVVDIDHDVDNGHDDGHDEADDLAGGDREIDDPYPDDAGVFCLDSEDEVKQKIATYEKNSGTHFIVLKKEKGYSQTGKE